MREQRSKPPSLHTASHVVYRLYAHVVLVTKYRAPVFREVHLDWLGEAMSPLCERYGARLAEFNGEPDHVHLLLDYPPKLALSVLVGALKSISSREIKRHFPELNQPAWRRNALWSPSYFACSAGGAPLEVLRRYIEQQNRSPGGRVPARSPATGDGVCRAHHGSAADLELPD